MQSEILSGSDPTARRSTLDPFNPGRDMPKPQHRDTAGIGCPAKSLVQRGEPQTESRLRSR